MSSGRRRKASSMRVSESRLQAHLDAIPLARPCPACGKRCFLTRRAAKDAARRVCPGEAHVSVYRCGDYFHFGHQPYGVRQGIQGRADWRPAR